MNRALQHIKKRFPQNNFQEENIAKAYDKIKKTESDLSVKILSVLGGFFSGIAFIAFLVITSFLTSGKALEVLGFITIVIAVFINTKFHKLLLDTFSIMLYLTGIVILVIGMNFLKINENTIIILVFFIGLITLIINQSYILSFIAILVLNGSILSLLFYNNVEDGIVVYLTGNLLLILLLFFNQAKIYALKNKISNLYGSYRIAFVFSFLFGMLLLSIKTFIKMDVYSWYGMAIIFAVSLLFVVNRILKILKITDKKAQSFIYLLSVLIASFSVFSPMIIGSLILILLGFYAKHKVVFITGILSFIYFTGKFYYDLNQTLLFKSLLLIGLGIVFLAFYLFTVKNTKIEKI